MTGIWPCFTSVEFIDYTAILPTDMAFAPKGVVVTGSTSKGIGRSLALALHDLPSKPKIIVTGRQQDKLDELDSSSDRIYGKRLDQLSPKEDLQRWVLRLLNEHQDIDTVVLNAGVQIPADFSRPDTVDLEAVSQQLPYHCRAPLTRHAASRRNVHQLHFPAYLGQRFPSSPIAIGESRPSGAQTDLCYIRPGSSPE